MGPVGAITLSELGECRLQSASVGIRHEDLELICTHLHAVDLPSEPLHLPLLGSRWYNLSTSALTFCLKGLAATFARSDALIFGSSAASSGRQQQNI
jgi:hypothetical protein